MNVCVKCCVRMLAVILLLWFANAPRVVAQDQRHVVSVDELSTDTARPAESRQVNEDALPQLFSSEQAHQARESANIDYNKVDNAGGALCAEDVDKLAERS